jgi:hypothetical protein
LPAAIRKGSGIIRSFQWRWLPLLSEGCRSLPQVFQNYPKLSEVIRSYPKLSEVANFSKRRQGNQLRKIGRVLSEVGLFK